MGHGYFTVVGYGFIVSKAEFIEYISKQLIDAEKNNQMESVENKPSGINFPYSRQIPKYHGMSLTEVEDLTEEDLIKEYCRARKIKIFFEEQQPEHCDDIFITVKNKTYLADARGACGDYQILDVKKLNDQELQDIFNFYPKLVGQEQRLIMYSFEGR